MVMRVTVTCFYCLVLVVFFTLIGYVFWVTLAPMPFSEEILPPMIKEKDYGNSIVSRFAPDSKGISDENYRGNEPTALNMRRAFLMAGILDEYFTRQGIEYACFFGTLLGIVRHGTGIPWDTTPMDFIVPKILNESIFMSAIKATLTRANFGITKYQLGYKVFTTKQSTESALIYEYQIRNGKLEIEKEIGKVTSINVDDVYPTRRGPFHRIMLRIPRNSKAILSQLYPEWETQCLLPEGPTKCDELRDLYPFVNATYKSIPKIIHQAWLGNKQPPMAAIQSCQELHPDWTYIIWNEKLITEIFPLLGKNAFQIAKAQNARADIIRWEVLYRFGGVWLDADVFCIRPLDSLLEDDLNFFLGYHNFLNPDIRQKYWRDDFLFAVSTVGTVPEHPTTRGILHRIIHQKLNAQGLPQSPWIALGPGVASREVASRSNIELSANKVGIYPFHMFLPYHLSEFSRRKKMFNGKLLPKDYPKVKMYSSYCFNFWGTTHDSYKTYGNQKLT